jgi:hypothetical protein
VTPVTGYSVGMVALMTRARTRAGAGTIAALILVLAFGNQVYAEWADKHAHGQNAWALLLRTLSWPRWSLSSNALTTRAGLALDLRALLVVVLVAALLGLTHSSVTDWVGGFVIGWFSLIAAAAVAAFLTAFVAGRPDGYTALLGALQAAGYGLVVGWIVGLVTGRSGGGAGASS